MSQQDSAGGNAPGPEARGEYQAAFHVSSNVTLGGDGAVFLDIATDRGGTLQPIGAPVILTPEDARNIALDILSAAECAKTDSLFVEVMRGMGINQEGISRVLDLTSEARDRRDGKATDAPDESEPAGPDPGKGVPVRVVMTEGRA